MIYLQMGQISSRIIDFISVEVEFSFRHHTMSLNLSQEIDNPRLHFIKNNSDCVCSTLQSYIKIPFGQVFQEGAV